MEPAPVPPSPAARSAPLPLATARSPRLPRKLSSSTPAAPLDDGSPTSTLPPLTLPHAGSTDAMSPRRPLATLAGRSQFRLAQRTSLDSAAVGLPEVDSWPLVPAPTSPVLRHATPSPKNAAASSPLSPRLRKRRAQHRVLAESRSQPTLLQELHAFLARELDAIGESTVDAQSDDVVMPHDKVDDDESDSDRDRDGAKRRNRPPNLRRLQIFRTLMQRLTEAFTVYSPLLAWIQHEYDAVVEHLLAQCQLIPQLHAELESLHTQCLQELSRHQIETKQRHHALKQTLKQTQAKLTAYAAQHARLAEENTALHAQVEELERRAAEMQQSNVSLVNGIKRHDETIRHIHERSRDEAIALQQITLKYHRAADEIAELKKTIASLEEKVGGVHIAADKATIGVLSRDLQELHAKYIRLSTRCICGVEGDSSGSSQYIPTTAVLNRVLRRDMISFVSSTQFMTHFSRFIESKKTIKLNPFDTGTAEEEVSQSRSRRIIETLCVYGFRSTQ
ncbi:hypothetical protein P43SY_004652 [Pythium insidiosum]|uniref:Translin-associated factor X-interacting protein 1 N-terminal domain-containing protein n=1 Tax=Pythium insidiosum TaxID=114742 RepID=A0AAD5L8S6_PYTIN|nr:hypothetical protein P43SY_004652 [Pythium insidiosum]